MQRGLAFPSSRSSRSSKSFRRGDDVADSRNLALSSAILRNGPSAGWRRAPGASTIWQTDSTGPYTTGAASIQSQLSRLTAASSSSTVKTPANRRTARFADRDTVIMPYAQRGAHGLKGVNRFYKRGKGDVKRNISPTTGSWAKIRLGIQPPSREFLMRRARSVSALGLPGSECVPSLQIQFKGLQAGNSWFLSLAFPLARNHFAERLRPLNDNGASITVAKRNVGVYRQRETRESYESCQSP